MVADNNTLTPEQMAARIAELFGAARLTCVNAS